MVRLAFRHITGARASQIDEIVLDTERELILGRGASASIRFDPHLDIRVGRLHARILWTGAEPPQFELEDLKSRNGTFLNGRLISAPVRLTSGDIIQLGALGPEVQVQWDMRITTKLTLIG
ncbi:MAG TPA: FHA domain-containing protein [Gemmatimonadaceae bacterium]|nr:FHA domain-containing protein [Gemmatimonadaceae bacterium]